MIVKGFTGRKDHWQHNAIIGGITQNCLDTSQKYKVPAKYIVQALVNANKSPHHARMHDVSEIRLLFEQFAKLIAVAQDTGGTIRLSQETAKQLISTHTLSAPQMAALLFFQSRWVTEPQGKVLPQMSILYEEVRKDMKEKQSFLMENSNHL